VDLLRSNIDVPMKDHYDGQFQELPTSKEIQVLHKVMRNQLEDQLSYCSVLSSTISHFLTLVA